MIATPETGQGIVLVLLGGSNDITGRLHPATLARVRGAAWLAWHHPELRILPTGHFGAHFNTSRWPHGELLTRELVRRGVARDRILPWTRTSRTVLDAIASSQHLPPGSCRQVWTVTSTFHLDRTRHLFQRAFAPGQVVRSLAVPDAANPAELQRRRAHERQSLSSFRRHSDQPLACL